MVLGGDESSRSNLAAAFRAMSKPKGPPPPAVVITLDTDPFTVDTTPVVTPTTTPTLPKGRQVVHR